MFLFQGPVPDRSPEQAPGRSPGARPIYMSFFTNFREPPSRMEVVQILEGTKRTDKLISKSGGARGVVVIAVENEHGDTSSNPGRY